MCQDSSRSPKQLRRDAPCVLISAHTRWPAPLDFVKIADNHSVIAVPSRSLAFWHPGLMWHWGNIGSFLAGLSTVVIAVAALVRSPGALRDFRARQAAQADAARAQAELAREQAEETRLERRRTLQGWSPGGVETYTVALVTDPAELNRAAAELLDGDPTSYVVLRVDEGNGSVNRARDLRALIERQGYLGRLPTDAEREALEKGFEALGVQVAGHWPRASS